MRNIIFLLLYALTIQLSNANNIQISNVSISGQNNALDFKLVNFDLTWDNSWNINSGPTNWDAAWVFVKYRRNVNNIWHHATLNYVDGTGAADGHTEPANSNISSSNDDGANGAHGVFIHRTDTAIGTVSFAGVKLRWNYGIDGLSDGDSVEICVTAIEMVYIPQGSFVVGSGGTESGAFYIYPTTTDPFSITNENAITVGTAVGNLYYTLNGDQSGPIPASFPKGFSAFYCMKYEITQSQYVDFLNKLTYNQQATRTTSPPSSVAGTAALNNSFRNGIDIKTPGIATGTPAVYANNLDGDGIYDEAVDGQSIACNWLSWGDLAAYLDWSGLRPMTELEYEKAGRGNQAPVPNEYAWGGIAITGANIILNSGANNEVAQVGSNSVYNNDPGVQGPMRVGNFAQAATTREAAGASYYGIMELSGNLWERPITVGNATGRLFTAVNGNGVLDVIGDANALTWPISNAIGVGFRGGAWDSSAFFLRLSDRGGAADTNDGRIGDFVGRGSRLAP